MSMKYLKLKRKPCAVFTKGGSKNLKRIDPEGGRPKIFSRKLPFSGRVKCLNIPYLKLPNNPTQPSLA